jgi:hypothetical protein
MNPIPGKCPVCNNTLTVTHLQCGQCGTGIDGQFHLGPFQALNPEQLHFVETFIKCRGKIKDVEAELDISYPTVVAKLNSIVQALGYEVDEKDLSEVDQFEMYQARVLSPKVGAPYYPAPTAPTPPTPPTPPTAPTPPTPPMAPRLSAESRQQILDDLEEGKISLAEAMKKLHG